MTASRIKFVKVEQEFDYVEARYDVMYVGKNRTFKIGQVTKDSVQGGRQAGGVRYYTSTFVKTVWTIESVEGKTAPGVYMVTEHGARVDAAVAILQKKGLSYEAARAQAGKRGL